MGDILEKKREIKPKPKYPMTPPVKEGEWYNLKIEGFGKTGDAFGKVLNYVIFIKLKEGQRPLKQGETYRVVLTNVLPNFSLGVLDE